MLVSTLLWLTIRFLQCTTAHVYLTFPLTEMCGHGRLFDRLRLYGNISSCDSLRLLEFGTIVIITIIIIIVITFDISTHLFIFFNLLCN